MSKIAERKFTKSQSRLLRRHRLFASILSLLCIYFIASIVTIQFKIYSRQQEMASLEQQIELQQEQNDEISRVVGGGSSDNAEYIEKIAREKLGYAGADERVFVDVAGAEG